MSGQLHTPAALSRRERAPNTQWIGSWVGSRAVLDAVVKGKISSPRRESKSKAFENVENLRHLGTDEINQNCILEKIKNNFYRSVSQQKTSKIVILSLVKIDV
jgi:hypothetical protein